MGEFFVPVDHVNRNDLGSFATGFHIRYVFPARGQMLLDLVQDIDYLIKALETLVAVLVNAFENQSFELRRSFRSGFTDWTRIQLPNATQNLIRIRIEKGQVAGEKLIQANSQREDVGPMIELFALGLFGGHVRQRSDDQAFILFRGNPAGCGQAEVDNLDLTLSGNHDVGELQVAMDYTHLMRFPQGGSNILGQGNDPAYR